MADLSDESDVNPSEMARMVEDLDDLDNTLLGGSTKRLDPFRDTKGDQETATKKVAFKDFDDDDPLADLLSDNETHYETKKPNARNTKSSLVADLFGIKNEKPEEKVADPAKPYAPPDIKKIEGTQDKIVVDENSSLPISQKFPIPISGQERTSAHNVREKSLTNEGISSRQEDSQKLPNVKARKSSLMEDLFGPRAHSAPSKEIEGRQNFSKPSVPNSVNVASLEPPKTEASTRSASGYTMDSGNTREPRRGRKNSPFISDPLGLFSAPTHTETIVQPAEDVEPKIDSRTDNKQPQEDLPEWLGGTAKGKEAKLPNEKQALSGKSLSQDPTSKSSTTIVSTTEENQTNEPRTDLTWQKNQDSTIFHPDLSAQMISTQFDQQATLIAMQQQEHELKTAATLSHQNEAVTKIVENQRAKLDEQGKMFNALIKHQLERQSILETQMKMQQARIDQHIQASMSQPTSLPIRIFSEDKSAKTTDEEEKTPRPESLVNKLELEKEHLKNTIEILREKHEKEITILQESYEKQMLFLRHGKEKLEKKMYEDYEALDTECERRIEKLKRERDEMEQTYKEEIERLKRNEKTLVEDIYARHSRNVELLQREHAETIDEISRAKEMERQAVDTIRNHETDLGDMLQRSQLVIESFQTLRKKFEDGNDEFAETRMNYLRKQEENLQLLRDQLNLQQDSLAEERKRLLEISQRLDASTAELTAEFRRNSLSINETQELLATRERTLIREKQLFDEQMKWERDHMQAIKEAWTKEQQRQMKFIFDEREAVANERAKLEVFSKLKSSAEDMAKVELEVALKTAQEAANEAIMEKRKWEEKCRSLDAEKRSLHEKEKHLIYRAQELENLTQSALKKRDEGLEALKEAKRTEQRYKQNLLQLQMQLESLAHRENKKASEKFARERLASKMYPAEKPEKDTVERVSSIRYANEKSLASNSHGSTHFKDVVDPQLLLLKLNLDNKLDATDDLLSTMQVISQ